MELVALVQQILNAGQDKFAVVDCVKQFHLLLFFNVENIQIVLEDKSVLVVLVVLVQPILNVRMDIPVLEELVNLLR